MKRTVFYPIITTLIVIVAMLQHEPVYPQYRLDEAFPSLTKFSFPLEMRIASDGTNRIFIVEQKGKIYVFDNSATATSKKIFLDISERVTQSGGEMGLLGLAFHPNYTTNGYFFVNYTRYVGSQLKSYIARYQVSASNPDSAGKATEKIFLTLDQPYENHNGGSLLFGSDGYLYSSFGDGGSGGDPNGNAQNKKVLLGKILRLNVDSASGVNEYSIPTANPFFGNTQGYREEIFSYGMRNVWKMSFDWVTGKLWAADVGQNAIEEIDTIRNGGNYGWNIMEGNSCYKPSTGCDTTGLIRPVWQYSHGNGDFSITGGFVYRGASIPSLEGSYVYGDYGSGRIWAVRTSDAGSTVNTLLIDKKSPGTINISSFGEDQHREIYVLSYGDGKIYKLAYGASGIRPTLESKQSSLRIQNYPNPFSRSARIVLHCGEASCVVMKIYEMFGTERATLAGGRFEAGDHEVLWDRAGLLAGVYYCIASAGAATDTKTMMLLP